MPTAIRVASMTTLEKLRAMETLWEALQANPKDVPSPGWHADVLRARAARAQGAEPVHGLDRSQARDQGARQMNVFILDEAQRDLVDGYALHEAQEPGLGDYFLDSLFSDIDSLQLSAGIHPRHFG